MICESCNKAQATRIHSLVENGAKRVIYQCDTCTNPPQVPKLERPCAQCKKREGHIKLTRLRPTGRVVTYVCDRCVTKT